MKPIAVTSGEPAGIGPDICLDLAASDLSPPLVVIGDLFDKGAITLEALEAMPEGERAGLLTHPDTLLADWPAVRLEAAEAARFLTGLRRRIPEPDRACVRVYGPEPFALLGSAHITAGELIADRLLSPAEVQGLPN